MVDRIKAGRFEKWELAREQKLRLPIPAGHYTSSPLGFWAGPTPPGGTPFPINEWECAHLQAYWRGYSDENERRLGSNYEVTISTYEPAKHPETDFSRAEYDRAWQAVYDALRVGM